MTDFKRISEERIQKAIEQGKFDNLPGKGRPLKLDDNPYEPEEWRAAHHLLKNNDFALPWMETWAEIEVERAAARRSLRQARDFSLEGPAWQRAVDAFSLQVKALNKRILEYNLTVPSMQFQKPVLDPQRELQAALEPTDP